MHIVPGYGSYMAVDPHTKEVVVKKRDPRKKESDVEFAAKKKAAKEKLMPQFKAQLAANPGSYMAFEPDEDENS